MFNSRKRLQRRTTPKDLNRFDYLQALVTEFQDTFQSENKEQTLANLANFAYDPINYEYFVSLHVPELFIDCIETDEDINGKIVEYGIGGLCNLAADFKMRENILSNDKSISLLIRCLSSSSEETVMSAITTLMQLITPATRHKIVTPAIVKCMQTFSAMPSARLSTLAKLFLEDYCDHFITHYSVKNTLEKLSHIPMPTDLP